MPPFSFAPTGLCGFIVHIPRAAPGATFKRPFGAVVARICLWFDTNRALPASSLLLHQRSHPALALGALTRREATTG